MLIIREFQPQDYDGLAWLENALYGGQTTSSELEQRDSARFANLGFLRLVALYGWGELIGYIEATQRPAPWFSRGEVRLAVREDFRRRGIGGALLGVLETELRAKGSDLVMLYTGEFDAGLNHFLWHRGYSESFRGYSQWLALEKVSPDHFFVDWQRLNAADVHLRSLAQLRHEWDCAQKFYELYLTLENDAPRADPEYTPVGFEEFCYTNFDSPSALPEGVTIAVQHGRYIGLNILYLDSSGEVLHNGLTGVRSHVRGLGLALALKLEGIRFAQRRGFRGITSFNASTNKAILRLNEKLGFERSPATIEWRKRL
ncbi:MAG: GNAT family N-acetyltransferase [Deinococcales bacterium]